MKKQDTKTRMSRVTGVAALCLSFALAGPACLDGDERLDDERADQQPSDEGEVIPWLWTGYASEETAPLACPSSQPVVSGVGCDGSYCDNISLQCDGPVSPPPGGPIPLMLGVSTWSSWFSEEGAASGLNYRKCSGDTWMTGIKCSGSYCDSVSIRCTEVFSSSGLPKTPGSCSWSDWYSEEDPFFLAEITPYPHRFLRGVKCQGSYCDQMAYYVCSM